MRRNPKHKRAQRPTLLKWHNAKHYRPVDDEAVIVCLKSYLSQRIVMAAWWGGQWYGFHDGRYQYDISNWKIASWAYVRDGLFPVKVKVKTTAQRSRRRNKKRKALLDRLPLPSVGRMRFRNSQRQRKERISLTSFMKDIMPKR